MGRMTLDELAAAAPRVSPAPVPDWAWGCFRRRSIAYATGQEDARAAAVRIQAQGVVGQLQIPAWRPDVSGREDLHACTVEELLELCAADGGVADAAWTAGSLARSEPSGFQPYDRWSEPALLQRVGPALIAAPPSGAYLEDWRLQPGCAGLLVALRLMFETGADGLTRPRDGGLVISGEHALFVLDRRRPLPSSAPLPLQMRQAGDPYAFADMAFDCEATYGRRAPDGTFVAQASTHPLREGRPMPVTEGFSQTSILEILRQQVGGGAGRIVRQWRIDTLIGDAAIGPATACDRAGAAWLEHEAQGLRLGP